MTTKPKCKLDCLHCRIGSTVRDYSYLHPNYSPSEIISDLLAITARVLVGGIKESGDEKSLENMISDLKDFVKSMREQEKTQGAFTNVTITHRIQ